MVVPPTISSLLLLGYSESSLIITYYKIVQFMKHMCPPNNRMSNNYGRRRRLFNISSMTSYTMTVCLKVTGYSLKRTQTSMHASLVGIQDGRGQGHNKGIKSHYHTQGCITCHETSMLDVVCIKKPCRAHEMAL